MLENDREHDEPRLDAEAAPPSATTGGYKVGYGRPPLENRFKPGTSGNKNGRPKGSRNAKSVVEKVIHSPITILENGKPRKTTQLEAMIQANTHKAMKGDVRALNAIVALLIRTGHFEELDREHLMTSLPEEDESIINDYMRRQFAGADASAVGNGGMH
jgi:Family of unknown function (DUF5681)